MKRENLLQAFESLLSQLSIDLRYEKGDFSGGLCKMPDRNLIIINSNLPLEQKINLIASELCLLELNHIYIRPVLREIISKAHETNP
ncbi:MAG TPA: hypothetical protein ENN22_11170 [bacterium]|nr:hypothetical protein [bacterium]